MLDNKLLREAKRHFISLSKKTNGALKAGDNFFDIRLYDPSENSKVLACFFERISGYRLVESREIDPDRVYQIFQNDKRWYLLEVTDFFQDPGYEQRQIETEGHQFIKWVYPLGEKEYETYENYMSEKRERVKYRVPFISAEDGMWKFFVAEISPPK